MCVRQGGWNDKVNSEVGGEDKCEGEEKLEVSGWGQSEQGLCRSLTGCWLLP